MESRGVRSQIVSMTAVAGAAVITAASVLSPVTAERADAAPAPTIAREARSMQVQLTAYNPVFPYAQPTGPLGLALTIPLAAATAVAVPVVQGATQLLTALRLDPRLAQQPLLLTNSLVLPVAIGAQVALSGVLGGTYVYGQFTPIQALNFFIDRLKAAIEGTIAAERNLFGLPALTALTTRIAGPDTSTHDIGSPPLVDEARTLTLSTAPEGLSDEAQTAAAPAHSSGAVPATTLETGATEDIEPLESSEPDSSPAEKPAWKRPVLKSPTLKVPTFKVPTVKIRIPRPGAQVASPAPKNGTSSPAGNTDSAPRGNDA